MEKNEAKIILSLVIGAIIGALYITVFGNYPIMPDLYYWFESVSFPLRWILFPIPFFPIISTVIGILYLEATKKESS
jgi:O-antigen/teichoic acid export membrane protein